MQLNETTFRKDKMHPERFDTGYFRGYGAPKPHLPPGRTVKAIKAILIHTTNGRGTDYLSEAAFLQTSSKVSIQYVVSTHNDIVAQVLPDDIIAWHAGDCRDNDFENTWSIGIEIAWTINKGPLPPIAIENVTELVRMLLEKYPWITKIDTHRAQALPPGRKIDPSGWADNGFDAWRRSILKRAAPASAPKLVKWRVKGNDLAPVYIGPSDATPTAKIGADPVRLSPGTLISVDATSDGYMHIVEPAAWGWTPVAQYELADVGGVLGEPLDDMFADAVLGDVLDRAPVTAESPLISAPSLTQDECGRYIVRRNHGEYTEHDILDVILPLYWRISEPVGLDPAKAVVQMIQETDNMSSALSQRYDKHGTNLRNPAGIGVWEGRDKATKEQRPGTVFDADVGGYRPACQFPSWEEAIKAQVGRLVAYATYPDERTAAQQQLVLAAMRYRELPHKCHGSAPVLRLLGTKPNQVDGCGWASPGDRYGINLANLINALRGQA